MKVWRATIYEDSRGKGKLYTQASSHPLRRVTSTHTSASVSLHGDAVTAWRGLPPNFRTLRPWPPLPSNDWAAPRHPSPGELRVPCIEIQALTVLACWRLHILGFRSWQLAKALDVSETGAQMQLILQVGKLSNPVTARADAGERIRSFCSKLQTLRETSSPMSDDVEK